ncbi:MAG: endonuclease/exonuclease/phosphatase family protein [Patulibacter minatonensis]
MPRPPLRRALRAAPMLAALIWVPWALAAWLDLDGLTWAVPSAVAFLPYVAAFTAVALVVAVAARARLAAAIAILGVLLLVAPRLGRITSDDQPAAHGAVVRIASSNLYGGRGDRTRLERIVSNGNVDIVALQENTARSDAALRAGAFGHRFPYSWSIPDPANGATGLAVFSRWPVERLPAAPGADRSLAVRIHVPGASTPLVVRSVHPYPPLGTHGLHCWRTCPPAFARAASAQDDTVLVGDYNATLDHHPIRTLMANGFRDAADQVGMAWHPTWSGKRLLHLTIDHAFVSRRIAVDAFSVHDLPPSDHDVIVAQLHLPA